MYTRFAKGVLNLLTVVLLIVAIWVAYRGATLGGELDMSVFIITAVMFIIIALLILMMFGVVVEMGNNIMDMAEMMKRQSTVVNAHRNRQCPNCKAITFDKTEYCTNCGAKMPEN
jgi:uncharacterized membrane protein